MNITKLPEPELNFDTFSAGTTALDHSAGYIDIDTSQNRLYTEMHDQLFDAALYALRIPTNTELSIIMALPYGWHDENSTQVSKRLTGKHHIVSSEKELLFHASVQTERQGILALVNMAFGWLSGANHDILENSILHDCGGMTTEHIHIKNKKDTDSSDSDENLGQWRIARRLKNHLTDTYHVSNITEFDCLEYISTKTFYSDVTGEIDLTNFIHREHEELALDIVKAGKKRIRKYNEIRRKYLTGGKAQDIFPYISRIIPGCVLSKEPLFDNVFGALKTAMNLAGKSVIPVGLDIGNQNTKAATFIGGSVFCIMFPSFTGDRTHGRTYA